MSVGLAALRKFVVAKVPLSDLGEYGINRDHFQDDEQEVFDFVTAYVNKYGKHPKLATVERELDIHFGHFPKEPFQYWADKVKRRGDAKLLAQMAKNVLDATKNGELGEALEHLQSAYSSLVSTNKSRVLETLVDAGEKVLATHDKHQTSGYMSGITFGLPYLDLISDGAQPSDTIAIVGRPGAGKSYIMANMALAHYDAKGKPLYAAYEMSNLQNARRIMALHTHLSATSIRQGTLSFYGRKKLMQSLAKLKKRKNSFYLMQGTLRSTVEDLIVVVNELKPSALYIDGAYLLRTASKTSQRWERVTETAEVIKMIGTEFNIPVFATYQFNRRGPGDLGNIAHADAVGQLASIVIGIDNEDEAEETRTFSAKQFKVLELLKGREGESGAVRIIYNMENMAISQDSVLKGLVPKGQA